MTRLTRVDRLMNRLKRHVAKSSTRYLAERLGDAPASVKVLLITEFGVADPPLKLVEVLTEIERWWQLAGWLLSVHGGWSYYGRSVPAFEKTSIGLLRFVEWFTASGRGDDRLLPEFAHTRYRPISVNDLRLITLKLRRAGVRSTRDSNDAG